MKLDEFKVKLTEVEKAREELLKLSREMRISATKAISAIHSKENPESYLNKALEILDEVVKYKENHPMVYYQITFDAMQELVEAYCFYHVISKKNLNFDFSSLNVEIPTILTGLADLIGELRRHTLDLLINGEFDEAKLMIEFMEKIYVELISFSFPNKIVPNLRVKLDVGRNAIERTKSDFIAARITKL
ncbi:translin [Archaeoglobales archaeon]|nr:MAG: translin [Archaeoglobales archaeon]